MMMGMLAIGNGEKCPFCEIIMTKDIKIFDHIYKNHKANLLPVCEKCHDYIHNGKYTVWTKDGQIKKEGKVINGVNEWEKVYDDPNSYTKVDTTK